MIVAAILIGVAVGALSGWLTYSYLEQNPREPPPPTDVEDPRP